MKNAPKFQKDDIIEYIEVLGNGDIYYSKVKILEVIPSYELFESDKYKYEYLSCSKNDKDIENYMGQGTVKGIIDCMNYDIIDKFYNKVEK